MITDNYIKMCEKAEEIQKLWRKSFKNYIGDLFWKGKKYLMIPEACSYVTEIMFEPEDNFIWLPTQEQLQEMISNNWYDVFCKFLWWHSEDDKNSEEFKSMFTSMNEVWLAFVIEEKYHKIWNGKEWEGNN